VRHTAQVVVLVCALLVLGPACSGDDDDVAGGDTTATNEDGATSATAAPERTFRSERYGFRVTLPEDWSEADAVADWDGKTLPGLASPIFARFADPANSRALVAAAAPVPEGMELAEWRAAMVRATPAVCPDPSPMEETTLGGEPALAWTHTCTDGYDVIKLAALHGRRGYIIFLASPTVNDDADDRHFFESIRSSFRFAR
jgi:hypothetical protein